MISAIILSHNDQKTIAKTLESVAWCDEIIVVDDLSMDKTVEIAKKFKVIVRSRALNKDFSSQRNYALNLVTNPWLLYVDSDEIISLELQNEIKKVITSHDLIDKKNGYLLKRIDYMWGREIKHGEPKQVRLLRLARRGPGNWSGKVHEVWQIDDPIGELINPIIHYPHPDVAQFIDEINHYSTIRAYELNEKGIRTNLTEILTKPAGKFLLNYFWRLGFLDGTAGMIYAVMMSMHSFLSRSKLYLLQNKPTKIP